MSDPLARALREIERKNELISDEVVVRRAPRGVKCCYQGYGPCTRAGEFEIRGSVKVYFCSMHLDDGLAFMLTAEKPETDMDMHVGRHSSIVTRQECNYRNWQVEGRLPTPLKGCHTCSDRKGKRLRCSERCKRYVSSRCICGVPICQNCYGEHLLKHGAVSRWSARGLHGIFGAEGSHRFEYRGMP